MQPAFTVASRERRGGRVEEQRHALLARMRLKRLDHRQPAADRHHPRRGGRDEIGRQRGEADAVLLQPAHGGPGISGERRHQLRVRHAMSLHITRPVLVRLVRVGDDVRVDVVAGVGDQQLLEIVADLALALHAEVGLSPSGVAAELVGRRALKHRDLCAGIGGSNGRGQARDAAADDQHVEGAAGLGDLAHGSARGTHYLRMNGSGICRSVETQTLLTSRNSLTASTPPSRPRPLSLKPPKGVVKLVER